MDDDKTIQEQDALSDDNLQPTDAETSNDAGDDLPVDNHSDYKPVDRFDASAVHHLSGMYKNWFLDYASYVILERAVPSIDDGLKPVQRRILHSMKRMDDGRYNKVANIVGHTMQFHPHGDASIGDALVQLGQKELLVDTQGNWGNILTGDRAAAPRYIEARLSKFALETVFNPKTTDWQLSYDGRNKEPIALPVKYPLLLAQGAEGIAVGLSSKILPHNFNEICDAAISYLKGEEFHLYPDFPTGGSIDVSKYNDGQRGGALKVRAKIEKLDSKTLVIREVPFTKTAALVEESITKAVEKGKLKIRRVDDMTAAQVEIHIHLAPGTSSDKTIDALYAFTDCEISLSPNCCVICDNKPQFLTVSDVLQFSVNRTKGLLKKELEIRKHELEEQLFFASLEQIFIEERIYKGKPFENARNNDELCAYIDERLTPFYPQLIREVRREDLERLLEIKMQRIAKFSKDKNEELIARINAEIKSINKDLREMTRVTIEWYEMLKNKYGAAHPRRTEIRSFDTIVAAKVAERNEKLYIDRQQGFVGYGLKKAEFVENCSDIDDVIIFYRTGKYKIIKIQEKVFVGKNILHVQIFNKKNDKRCIYNVVYRDGQHGSYFIKRFNVTSCTRDREYDLTQGTAGSRVVYFTANPNGEAEIIKITLDPNPKKKKQNIFLERDFSEILIKGRASKGNLLTRESVHRITLKSHGHSTLGGRKVWFDPDVNRINYEEHGRFLGEFSDDDRILVVLSNGDFYITNFDSNNHYESNILRIEKWDDLKVWTAIVLDADNQGYAYLKRFTMDASKRPQSFLGENEKNQLLCLTDKPHARFTVTYGAEDADHGSEEFEAETFVGVKGFKAKGKRLTTLKIGKVEEIDTPYDEPEDTAGDIDSKAMGYDATTDGAQDGEQVAEERENLDPDRGKSQQQVIDEITGQLNLFDNDNDK